MNGRGYCIFFNYFIIRLLQFIKNMIYFNKLIDICINREESQKKVVDNYANGTITQIPFEDEELLSSFSGLNPYNC